MVEYPANDTNSEDIINITTSDDESEGENGSISPPTLYSAGMHMSGDDTDREGDPNLLDTDENDSKINQTNQNMVNNDVTEQQNNGTTLQENVKDRKRKDRHTNSHEAMGKSELMETPVKYLGFVVGNSSVGLTDESEADNYADPPALTTNNPDTDTYDTGYD